MKSSTPILSLVLCLFAPSSCKPSSSTTLLEEVSRHGAISRIEFASTTPGPPYHYIASPKTGSVWNPALSTLIADPRGPQQKLAITAHLKVSYSDGSTAAGSLMSGDWLQLDGTWYHGPPLTP